MRAGRAYQAICIIDLTTHNGINGSQGGSSGLNRCLIGMGGNVSVGGKKTSLAVALMLFPCHILSYGLDLANICPVMHRGEFVLGSGARWDLNQSITFQPVQSLQNFHCHLEALRPFWMLWGSKML